jgi:hypothetical protein
LTPYDGLVPLKERDWFQPLTLKMKNSDQVNDQSLKMICGEGEI